MAAVRIAGAVVGSGVIVLPPSFFGMIGGRRREKRSSATWRPWRASVDATDERESRGRWWPVVARAGVAGVVALPATQT